MIRSVFRARALPWLLAAVAVPAGIAGWLGLTRPTGALVPIPEFGDNPTQLEMHLYVPKRLTPRPAVLLALHWCQGSGPAFHSDTGYARLADRHGFLVIYPSATRASRCWDVHSPAALTHDGGSDPRGLIAMIRYALERRGADRERVFVTGHSSGGMMTQLLLGAYPDVFHAGAAFAGVPFGCFAGPKEWNEDCALGRLTRSPEEWGALVRRAYPDFTGRRPSLQLWHGTDDDSVSFHNFGEAIKQWTNVLGVDAAPVAIDTVLARARWTGLRYASSDGEVRLEALRGEGAPHNVAIPAEEVIDFFGLGDP